MMRINSVYQTVQLMGVAALASAPAQAAPTNARSTPWIMDLSSTGCTPANSIVLAGSKSVQKSESKALRSLGMQFAALRTLENGWDGPSSFALDREVLSSAARILNRALAHSPHVQPPRLVPVSDGSLQAEWYTPDHRLEVYFDSDGEISAWSEARASRVEMEEDGLAAVQLLVDWVAARESDALSAA